MKIEQLISKAENILRQENLKPINLINNNREGVIVISGGNGFFAQYIIKELLKRNEKIIALVRDKTKYKNEENLIYKNYSDEINYSIKIVIHCAAQLNNLYTFNQLKRSNIDLTIFLLKKFENVPFHYISTLSIFASSNQNGEINEDTLLKNETEIYGGYAQTKFVSDYIVRKLGGKVYRFDLITPEYENPVLQENTLLKIIKEMPSKSNINQYKKILVSMNPVDLCAKKFIECLNKDEMIYHITGKEISLFQINENNKKTNKHFISKLHLKLYKQTYYRKQINEKTFNLDLFQTTNFKWLSKNKVNYNIEIYLKKLFGKN